jgi:phosphate transport system permease protein
MNSFNLAFNLFLVATLLAPLCYWRFWRHAQALESQDGCKLSSRPNYHGLYGLIWTLAPTFLITGIWLPCSYFLIRSAVLKSYFGEDPYSWIDATIALAQIYSTPSAGDTSILRSRELLATLSSYNCLAWLLICSITVVVAYQRAFSKLSPSFNARLKVETVVSALLKLAATLAILVTLGILASLLAESLRFFTLVSPIHFLLGTKWSPQQALYPGQASSAGAFGAIPLFTGTFLIAGIAMLVSGPIGLFSAIFLSEYGSSKTRKYAKPLLEILAGIPTVVYGFFAALTVAPWLKGVGANLGLSVSSESALAAGVVMGVMIVPLVSSLSDDVLKAVPQNLRDGSLALGATRSETICKVVLPAALPGIVGSFLLAVSRAIGETMIVVMAAGLAAKLTLNPFQNVTTATVQIVTALVGDQEFDSPKTLSVFALGLVLFILTLLLNVLAYEVVRKYREKYE